MQRELCTPAKEGLILFAMASCSVAKYMLGETYLVMQMRVRVSWCAAQRECGVKQPLRVVPLFETLDDLEYSESAMEQLLSNPWYADHIKGVQECMIGYSDSGKDAGRLAAAWGLYEVQVRSHAHHMLYFDMHGMLGEHVEM